MLYTYTMYMYLYMHVHVHVCVQCICILIEFLLPYMYIAPIKPDPWAQFSAATSDPRLLYVVHPGPASSPLPVPLHPDDVVSLLKTAERRYLSQRIRIDVAAKEVCVCVCVCV